MEETYMLILIALVTVLASYVQGVTGFGFGIVAMIFCLRFCFIPKPTCYLPY